MKNYLTIILLLFYIFSFSQKNSVIPRSTNNFNTLTDQRVSVKQILVIPLYLDTISANTKLGEDSSGAVIKTSFPETIWFRANFPSKHWINLVQNIPVQFTGSFQPLEDQRLRTTDNITHYKITGTGGGIVPSPIGIPGNNAFSNASFQAHITFADYSATPKRYPGISWWIDGVDAATDFYVPVQESISQNKFRRKILGIQGTFEEYAFMSDLIWANISNKPIFSIIATSGDYNDLSNKPLLPILSSGTYTSTISNTINSTSLQFHNGFYTRNGNIVQFQITFSGTPTVDGTIEISFTLPFSTTMVLGDIGNASISLNSGSLIVSGRVTIVNSTTAKVRFYCSNGYFGNTADITVSGMITI